MMMEPYQEVPNVKPSNVAFIVFSESLLGLVEGMLSRFDDELQQIKLKKSIGGKNRRNQHSNREDAISLAKKTELSDFNGCGIELPDLLDLENLAYFLNWNGELRFVQNIKLKRFRRSDLIDQNKKNDTMNTVELEMELN